MNRESQLSELDERILAFEQEVWARRSVKEAAIRSAFGVSPVRYYQMLNQLLDSPVALRHDPSLIHRLQRIREARLRARGIDLDSMSTLRRETKEEDA